MCFDTRRPPEYEVALGISFTVVVTENVHKAAALLVDSLIGHPEPRQKACSWVADSSEMCRGKPTWDWCLASSSCLAFISQADNKLCDGHSDEGAVTDSWGDSQKRGCWWESLHKESQTW